MKPSKIMYLIYLSFIPLFGVASDTNNDIITKQPQTNSHTTHSYSTVRKIRQAPPCMAGRPDNDQNRGDILARTTFEGNATCPFGSTTSSSNSTSNPIIAEIVATTERIRHDLKRFNNLLSAYRYNNDSSSAITCPDDLNKNNQNNNK